MLEFDILITAITQPNGDDMKTTPRFDILRNVNNSKHLICTECKEPKTMLEICNMFEGKHSKVKMWMHHLVKENYLVLTKQYNQPTKRWINSYSLTDKEFKLKTDDEIWDDVRNIRTKAREFKIEGKYDQMIADNPNLRTVKLFDTKDNSYFLNGQTGKTKGGIGSTFSMYDTASGFDS